MTDFNSDIIEMYLADLIADYNIAIEKNDIIKATTINAKLEGFVTAYQICTGNIIFFDYYATDDIKSKRRIKRYIII